MQMTSSLSPLLSSPLKSYSESSIELKYQFHNLGSLCNQTDEFSVILTNFQTSLCAQQPRDIDSGYYVMRYMYEIISTYRECKGNLKEVYLGRDASYNDGELNEIREQWSRFFRTKYLLKD
ncbi:uncharacterized protein LOC110711836 [Chenopodium quinoa]|uniref:uncharacterized protein LOC110711836 n=1 Tax=Chenopodium quinoa TaxID=63459 RepID=UPI000B771446|nr:uncharacterized protein LOC110711836 [Chenopodium quinoa]